MTQPEELLLIAVPAAVLAAGSFGLAQALQHRAARRTRETGTVRFRMIPELVHQPSWLASLLANGSGVALQWVALSFAPLILVQPLLVTGLLFAVLISSALHRQRLDRVVISGTALCGAGLAAFILIAAPEPGQGSLTFVEVLPLAGGLTAILAACIVTGVRHPGPVRALALATATGVLYGVTAGLTKLAVTDLGQSIAALFSSWPIYLVIICGPLGFVLNQNAFRVGVALAPALAVIIGIQPLVSIGIGVLWLDEHLRGGPMAILGQLIALGVLLAGVVILSRRAPQTAAGEQREEVSSGSPSVTPGQEQERHDECPRGQQA